MPSEPVSIDPVVHLEFQLTEREFKRAVRQFFVYLPRNRWGLAASIVCIAVGLLPPVQREVGGILVVIGISWLVGRGIGSLVGPWRSWRRSFAYHDDVRLVFNAQSVSLSSPSSSLRTDWSRFRDVIESEDNYFIRTKGRGLFLVPKRAFLPGDEGRFRAIVMERLPTRFSSDARR